MPLAVVPKPVSLTPGTGAFVVRASTRVSVSPATPETARIAAALAGFLSADVGPAPAPVALELGGPSSLGAEGYDLTVTPKAVRIVAHEPAGLFYGVQTVRQLLGTGKRLPAVRIRDRPRFGWRGAMLDVARHFRPVRDVKRYIDLLALYKLNRLHLHLSDDQGWRIAISKWPRLATWGGSTEVGGGRGGYYTQRQYSDIVRYAAQRYVEIVPEIDMPGHVHAALSSYPKLSCDGKKSPLYTGISVGFSSLCVSKPLTYDFLSDVIGELARLTPGPFIHIGGDEAQATKGRDYVRFINRVQSIVGSYGKRMIGWEEIARARIDRSTVVQQWNPPGRTTAAAEAAARGFEGDHVAGEPRVSRHEVRRLDSDRPDVGRVLERARRVHVGADARDRGSRGGCGARRRGAALVGDDRVDGGRGVPGVSAADRDRRDRLVAATRPELGGVPRAARGSGAAAA